MYLDTEKVAELLLKKGALIESRDEKGNSPLSVAVYLGNLLILKQSIEKIIEYSHFKLLQDSANRKTECMISIKCSYSICFLLDNEKVTETLVKSGADVNSTSFLGYSPLLVAAYNGKFIIFILR